MRQRGGLGTREGGCPVSVALDRRADSELKWAAAWYTSPPETVA